MELLKLLIGQDKITLWILITSVVVLALLSPDLSSKEALTAIIAFGGFKIGSESGGRIPGDKE